MSFEVAGPRALRQIVAHALGGVLVGPIPARLVRALEAVRSVEGVRSEWRQDNP